MSLTTMKLAWDMENPKKGVSPAEKTLKWGEYLDMTTHKDQEIYRAMRKICETSDELKDGGMPQCKIVTNIRHRMSPYKTL